VTSKTVSADWRFIVMATLIWVSALIVTAWGFIVTQRMNCHFGSVNIIGLTLILTGIFIRRIAKRILGKYYSYSLKILRGHKLIKHGIYRHIRHPCHLAMILYSVGIPTLFFSSIYGFFLMLGLIPCVILYRIKIEEKMLIEKFGIEYSEYMKKTKRLILHFY